MRIFEIPHKIQEEYGTANIGFWAIYYKFLPRGSINFVYVALYDNFLIFKGLHESYLINIDNFIEFQNKKLFKPYSIKFKTNDIYKYKEISFNFLSNKNAKILKTFTEELK